MNWIQGDRCEDGKPDAEESKRNLGSTWYPSVERKNDTRVWKDM